MTARRLEKINLGSRGSELAQAQTALVAQALRGAWPDLDVATQIISTRGDQRTTERIDPRAGRKGLFTGEIEGALAAGEIDVAVHSAKDLPSDATPGLDIWGTLPRASVEDVLISKTFGGLSSLRPNAVVATGSIRRQYQLRWKYPQIQVADLRGNVPTRLRKLMTNEWDAIVLARAGLERLGYEVAGGSFSFEGAQLYVEILPSDQFLPAGGQGVIAMQVRTDDQDTKTIVNRISPVETLFCLQAEREFLRLLQGDCGSPVGVLATFKSGVLKIRAQVFEPGKSEPRAGEVRGSVKKGLELAAELLERINGG